MYSRSGTRLYGDHPPHTFIWETVQKNIFTIDYEGLYDEPYGRSTREIARDPDPITFQCPDTNRIIGF